MTLFYNRWISSFPFFFSLPASLGWCLFYIICILFYLHQSIWYGSDSINFIFLVSFAEFLPALRSCPARKFLPPCQPQRKKASHHSEPHTSGGKCRFSCVGISGWKSDLDKCDLQFAAGNYYYYWLVPTSRSSESGIVTHGRALAATNNNNKNHQEKRFSLWIFLKNGDGRVIEKLKTKPFPPSSADRTNNRTKRPKQASLMKELSSWVTRCSRLKRDCLR